MKKLKRHHKEFITAKNDLKILNLKILFLKGLLPNLLSIFCIKIQEFLIFNKVNLYFAKYYLLSTQLGLMDIHEFKIILYTVNTFLMDSEKIDFGFLKNSFNLFIFRLNCFQALPLEMPVKSWLYYR